jgi:hypothetical protein
MRPSLLALLLLAAPLHGQCPGGVCPVQPRVSEGREPYGNNAHPWARGTVDDCVCQVQSGNAFGSGVCVAYDADSKRALILTAAHVAEGGKEFRCTFPDGASVPAAVAASDATADVAVLVASSDRPLRFTHVGADDARPGARILKIGFPAMRHVIGEGTAGEVHGQVAFGRLTVRPGDSGCGVFDARGYVVGVVSGFVVQRDDTAIYCCVGPIRRLLDRCREDWLKRRQQPPPPRPAPAPPRPRTQTPEPPPAQPDPFNPPAARAEVDAALADVQAKLAALEKALATQPAPRPGPAGPAGPAGPQGPPGPRGDPGKAADAGAILSTLDRLAAVQAAQQKQIDSILQTQPGPAGTPAPLRVRIVPAEKGD